MMVGISFKILCGVKLGRYGWMKFDKMLINIEAGERNSLHCALYFCVCFKI